MSTRHPSMITIAYGPEAEHVADLHLPAEPPPAGSPVVVLIHGGFWRSYWRRDLMTPLAEDLVAAGAVVWNVEYRRVGAGGGVPSTLRDIAHAVDLLDLLGPRFGFAVDDLAVVGHSAGGHLAAWSAQRSGGDAEGIRPPILRPGRLLALAPVLDLVEAERRALGGHATAEFIGARLDDDQALYERLSPAHHLPLGVPMMIVHGTADDRVPHEMSVAHVDAARAVGDAVSLVSIDGGDHVTVIDPTTDAWATARAWLGL